MLKHFCIAALCASLGFPVAHAQDKSPATGAPKAAKPKPAPDPAPRSSAAEDSAGVQAIEAIFACVAQGLPEGWQRAWVIVTELSATGGERSFEGRFLVSLEPTGDQRWKFVPCNSLDVAQRVYALNDFLQPEKRQWKVATLLFTPEGKFELKYDYTR